MKITLSNIEQENLRIKGILYSNEIAYREEGLVYAENVLTNEKRVINMLQTIRESKVIFG